MPADIQNRTQRRAKGKLAAGEGTRAVIVTTVLVCVMLTGFFVTARSYLSSDRSENPHSKIPPLTASSTQGEAAHRSASIVMETGNKGRCEDRQFDNRTGRIVSSNTVDCDARLAPERDSTHRKTSRVSGCVLFTAPSGNNFRRSIALQNNVLHHRIDLVLPGLAGKNAIMADAGLHMVALAVWTQ